MKTVLYYNILIFVCVFFTSSSLFAQTNLLEAQPQEEFSHISINRIYSDEFSTSFLIWVMDEVKPHLHKEHTESLYVLEGTGVFTLDKQELIIKPGDFIAIPKNTVHSVKVTSNLPLKVLSVQAPEFLGEDRTVIK